MDPTLFSCVQELSRAIYRLSGWLCSRVSQVSVEKRRISAPNGPGRLIALSSNSTTDGEVTKQLSGFSHLRMPPFPTRTAPLHMSTPYLSVIYCVKPAFLSSESLQSDMALNVPGCPSLAKTIILAHIL